MTGFGAGHCFPYPLFPLILVLSLLHAIIAFIASLQLLRIHLRSLQEGWTRQKVFHLLIGSSNWGYFTYLALILLAACKGWTYWSHSFGFIFMAFPKVLCFAAFLLLLSFWVDLCHQSNDDDDYEGSFSEEPLLGKTSNESILRNRDRHRKCFPIRFSRIGNRQKIVLLVMLLIFITMMAFSVIIWIGLGKNPIDSEVAARVYLDVSAIGMLFLGGALACYGILLCLKMSKVRAEKPSSEMGKVAGLTVVSVLCFTSSSCVELLTDVPMMYHWHPQRMSDVYVSLLLILYYFVGSSIPSAVVLWVMRELPPAEAVGVLEESSTLAFVANSSVAVHHPQRWTTVTSMQNQIDLH
ncbi:tobamovirus multiplication protein 1-like isoform X2 [Cicer arietinum]|uniref:Tobamovirus multiplication protein 1-like isoform X2 n=1 Tax=Cicer arietinum TaxID=3827 RepID=A0A1S3EAT0_CICAR|nr:tobamovirus multiplication protein 1-like isoform X2 [Cicer arietinum]